MSHQPFGLPIAAAALALILNPATAATVTFETVPLPPSGYWNGSDGSGGITINGYTFGNSFNPTWGNWSGFAISNHFDSSTAGWTNQYSAYPGTGAGGSANYAVGYYSSSTSLNFGALTNLAGAGASFTNTTYAALDMLHGGDFGSKKFGGATGNDADWFLLTISGFASGAATGTSVDFYLADFRFADNASDYIVTDWRNVDFTPLGTVDELRFSLTSSDVGTWGMNTPGYFAMDNLSVVPEPSVLLISLSGIGLLARRKR